MWWTMNANGLIDKNAQLHINYFNEKKLTAMMKVMVMIAELDMTRALFGSRAMRDGNRDSARTSNLFLSLFEI